MVQCVMFTVMPNKLRARESQQRVNSMDIKSFGYPYSTGKRQQPECLFHGTTKGNFHKADALPFDARV